jgi:hypothetical protein
VAYCIHVTRKHLPNNKDILLKNWESLVNHFPEMELQSSILGKNNSNGNTIEIGGDGSAVWSRADRKTYFTFYGGIISTSETDPAVQHHMHYLAHYLKAEVRGDEGELYETPDFILKEIGDNDKSKTLGKKADDWAIKATKVYDKLWFKILFFTSVIVIYHFSR